MPAQRASKCHKPAIKHIGSNLGTVHISVRTCAGLLPTDPDYMLAPRLVPAEGGLRRELERVVGGPNKSILGQGEGRPDLGGR